MKLNFRNAESQSNAKKNMRMKQYCDYGWQQCEIPFHRFDTLPSIRIVPPVFRKTLFYFKTLGKFRKLLPFLRHIFFTRSYHMFASLDHPSSNVSLLIVTSSQSLQYFLVSRKAMLWVFFSGEKSMYYLERKFGIRTDESYKPLFHPLLCEPKCFAFSSRDYVEHDALLSDLECSFHWTSWFQEIHQLKAGISSNFVVTATWTII